MPMIYICPRCTGQIVVPDDERVPPGSTVQHAPGQCPTDVRPIQYDYVGTFILERYGLDENGERTGDPVELSRVGAEVKAAKFREIGTVLATKVGDKLSEVIKHADLIDMDDASAATTTNNG